MDRVTKTVAKDTLLFSSPNSSVHRSGRGRTGTRSVRMRELESKEQRFFLLDIVSRV